MEVVWEFQEFQQLKTSQTHFKRRKRVEEIKNEDVDDGPATLEIREGAGLQAGQY